ncbi:MAG: hypothetical protein GY830_08210 [Bacteroidetes bacterium]|nr:hypothetical protein [Bacteroidota bacterium]
MKNIIKEFDFFGDFVYEDLLEDKISNIEFKRFFITIYDHWLSEEEFRNSLITYWDILDGTYKLSEYLNYENKYINMFNEIFHKFSIFTFDNDFDIIPKLNLIKSKSELKEILQDSLREKRIYNFVIPELEVIILGKHDLTRTIYMKPSNEAVFKLAENYGLYILK